MLFLYIMYFIHKGKRKVVKQFVEMHLCQTRWYLLCLALKGERIKYGKWILIYVNSYSYVNSFTSIFYLFCRFVYKWFAGMHLIFGEHNTLWSFSSFKVLFTGLSVNRVVLKKCIDNTLTISKFDLYWSINWLTWYFNVSTTIYLNRQVKISMCDIFLL